MIDGQAAMWRQTMFLKRAAGLDRGAFVTGWEALSRQLARRPGSDRPARIILNLPLDPPVPELAAMFGDRYDGVGEFWFASRDAAVRTLLRMERDEALRRRSDALLDGAACSRWLAESVPHVELPGTGVKFVVAGQQAEGYTVDEAQRYWREMHPPLFRAVDDFMAHITRYVQMHGRDVPELAQTQLFGRYDFYPMCADMGLRRIEDVAVAYALPSYLATIRPDELKFSKQGEMLSFASTRSLVLE